MSKLRIAVVSDAVMPFHKGGKEARIYHLTTHLAALGHDVHIYTMKWWEGPRELREGGVTFHAISRYYPLYAGDRRSIVEGVMFGLATLKMAFFDFDVLEVDHMPFFPLYAAKVVSLLKRRPLVATWHEVWGKTYWREYLGWRGMIAYAIERISVALPDKIVAVSDQTRDELRTILSYRGPLEVIPNGIDYQAITQVPPAVTSSDIIFTGRLLAHKRVDLLVEAVALLINQYPNLACLIVGDGPERERLAKMVASRGLDAHVSFTGRVEQNQDVFAAMKASKVFVLPSEREGFGITLLEAMACGLPVVTVAHPQNAATALVSARTGLVAEPNAASLAGAIDTLLQNPRHDHRVAKNYDWESLATKVEEAYAL